MNKIKWIIKREVIGIKLSYYSGLIQAISKTSGYWVSNEDLSMAVEAGEQIARLRPDLFECLVMLGDEIGMQKFNETNNLIDNSLWVLKRDLQTRGCTV